ncbi:lytic murein transglycosylase B [Methylococcus sp. EFPC2]|uniref:lytic murein transglycosylase B n=1 Tax=Methylococcus sp. EFPC2 TaxID=2812648 RepID=UPI0019670611|nr:lytic murein transglycosylase B [Methylococcus sp. EFPC2]QSA96134.1 lytic murein transglycosylase B [Methylococcus sp. EFPC2]
MKPVTALISFALAQAVCAPVVADIADRPDVRAFMQEVSARHRFAPAELENLFRQVDLQDKVLESISKPAEAKPWREYRKIFLTEKRIQAGANFWSANRAALEQAQDRYGVAPEMVVAILGVETTYGKRTGNYRVIDALSTLAFDYPRRADFFRKELEAFLLLCREEGVDPLLLKGSYAGAMGLPQFMPSSYRNYAADLERDGKRDIWGNPADAIASVARYFAENGWQSGGSVALPAKVAGNAFSRLLGQDVASSHTLPELLRFGVRPAGAVPPGAARYKLLSLEGESGLEYWLTLHNFEVITRYNHSPLYAMAAFQLGREVAARREPRAAP